MKYTKEYIANHRIAIHTKTKEEFGIVTRKLKISSTLRDYNWNSYREESVIVFYDGKLTEPCVSSLAYGNRPLITFEEFCLGNNIFIETYYEIY